MSKSKEKLNAQELRKNGESIKEIARKLGVSKGSVSVWCRDVKLSKKQSEVLYRKMVASGHAGRILGAQANQQKRLDKIKKYDKKADKLYNNLSERELMLIGCALYWAEGGKPGARLKFSNSDPKMISFIMRWFRESLNIASDRFYFQVIINETHKDRINTIEDFWSKLVKCSRERFWKPHFVKTKNKKVYSNHDNYYGTLHVYVKNPVEEKYMVMGIINTLSNNKNLSG